MMDDLAAIAILAILAVSAFTALSLAGRSNRPGYRRVKTAREDAMHDQIQQAMNWTPGMARKCKDGKWRDADGNEYVSVKWSEIKGHLKDEE